MSNTETKIFDIKKQIFDNETEAEAILYVIKDKETIEDQFIFSLPIYCFSYVIYGEKDFTWHLYNIIPFGDPQRKEKFIELMKKIIKEWDL
jgi:hypothetical protein